MNQFLWRQNPDRPGEIDAFDPRGTWLGGIRRLDQHPETWEGRLVLRTSGKVVAGVRHLGIRFLSEEEAWTAVEKKLLENGQQRIGMSQGRNHGQRQGRFR